MGDARGPAARGYATSTAALHEKELSFPPKEKKNKAVLNKAKYDCCSTLALSALVHTTAVDHYSVAYIQGV